MGAERLRKEVIQVVDIQTKTVLSREERFKVELTRGQRGGYGWTVTVYAPSVEQVLEEVELLEQSLRKRYGNGNPDDPYAPLP